MEAPGHVPSLPSPKSGTEFGGPWLVPPKATPLNYDIDEECVKKIHPK